MITINQLNIVDMISTSSEILKYFSILNIKSYVAHYYFFAFCSEFNNLKL